MWLQKPDTDRSSDWNLVPRRLEGAGSAVDSEDDDAVAALVGDETEFTGRVDVEVSRRFDIGGFVLDEGQRSFGPADSVDRDAIVAAVGAVEEPAARMNAHLGARAGAVECLGKRRDCLDFRQSAGSRLVCKSSDGAM